jgi:hypothetical protein
MCRRLIWRNLLVFSAHLASTSRSYPTNCVDVYLGGMRMLLLPSFLLLIPASFLAQVVPTSSTYNADIVWESVFAEGPAGKVNRGVADSEGHIGLVFMPEDVTRVHRIHGETGALMWTRSIEGTAGFGIAVYEAADGPDYIVTGGIGDTQERWMARLDGADGSTVWSKTYTASGGGFDGIRMAITGSDGLLYGAGFTGGDEAGTIFVVYAGAGNVVKVHPADGALIWSEEIPGSEYVLAVAEAEETLFCATAEWDADLGIAALSTTGSLLWQEPLDGTADIIPYDLATDGVHLYYGGHRGRPGAGNPFDFSCVKTDLDGQVEWIGHYANPRGYSLSHIRNELYGVKADATGVYLFGGTGDESGYSEQIAPYESSDVWNGWALKVDHDGDILHSAVFCQGEVNTATEYGCLIDGGYVLFNDTDAGGDTEVGVMRIAEPQTTGLAGWQEATALIDLVHRQGARIVVPHQPVTCTLLDALGRTLWAVDVDGPTELPVLDSGWGFLEIHSSTRREIRRLPPH